MVNYLFPNEPPGEVLWGIIIVLYPFMTCMVDGCAFVASVPYLFKNRKLRPITRLALLCSLSFAPFAFVPLLLDIGRPERAFHIMMTPRLSSPMAIFGFIFSFVIIVVGLTAWLTFRPDLVNRWKKSTGLWRYVYGALSLGVSEITPQAKRIDKKLSNLLEIIALPAAAILTGYVGFIFGTVPANPWWSSPLRPVVFIGAAASGGFAMVLTASLLWQRSRLPEKTVRSLGKCLTGSLIVVAALTVLEVVALAYPGGTAQNVLFSLFGKGGPLHQTFFYGQLLLGIACPVVLLGGALLFGCRGLCLRAAALISGVLGIAHTLFLLWNVVVGGQLFSKSLRGIIDYHPHWGGQKGVIATLVVLVLPVGLLVVYSFFVPVFKTEEKEVPVEAAS